jgi:hypothetical protein
MTGARSFVLCSTLAALGACNRGGDAGARGGSGAGSSGAQDVGDASAAGSAGGAAAIEDASSATFDGADSTVVLTVAPNDGMPLAGISTLAVTVQADQTERAVTFAHAPEEPIDAAGVALSLGVSAPEAGEAIFSVEARTATGCQAAKGLATVSVAAGSTVHATVQLARSGACASADGAAIDDVATDGATPDGGAFPGCDPVAPDCPDGMMCELVCATRKATCAAAGDGFHGTACASDQDCAPGSACVDYVPRGCAVKICRQLCATEANCPQPIQLVMPRNVCSQPFTCSGAATPYHTCSVSCDPTAQATASGTTTCEDGLACVLLDASHADCTCPAPTRTKAAGAACATNDDCLPGLACALTGATRACRAVCRCYAENGACTADEGDCPTAGAHCAPLVEGGVFGVCGA